MRKTLHRFLWRPFAVIGGFVGPLRSGEVGGNPLASVFAKVSFYEPRSYESTKPLARDEASKSTAKNFEEIVQQWKRDAGQGIVEAQYNLGVCYSNGEGVREDADAAVHWYRQAADQGYIPAQYNLGISYLKGEGVREDADTAVHWFRQAAEQEDAKAQYNLGACYFEGKGVERNYAEAVRCFRQAAEQGYALAQHNLGFFYYFGMGGMAKSRVEASKWLNIAAASGHELAIERKNFIANSMTPDEIAEARRLSVEWMEAYESRRASE